MADKYATVDEWLSDPDPYGEYAKCKKCGAHVRCEHYDVFHEGVCSCGFVVDEPCDHHSSERGMCQLHKDTGA